MKINPFLACIALAIAALAAFGFYSANAGDETSRWLITIGAGVSFFVTLGGIIALSSPNGGSLNIKVTALLFFLAFLVEHLVFSFIALRLAPYVIVTGILLLLFVMILYAIIKALK